MNLRVNFGELVEFVISRIRRCLVIGDQNAFSRGLRKVTLETYEVDLRRLFAKVRREMERDAVDVGELDDLRGILHAAVGVTR